MNNSNIIEILTDISLNRKNFLGDYWSLSFCATAAKRIQELEEKNIKLTETIQAIRKGNQDRIKTQKALILIEEKEWKQLEKLEKSF